MYRRPKQQPEVMWSRPMDLMMSYSARWSWVHIIAQSSQLFLLETRHSLLLQNRHLF